MLVLLSGAVGQLEPGRGDRGATVVDDLDVLAAVIGSALHDRADVQPHAHAALVLSVQRDV